MPRLFTAIAIPDEADSLLDQFLLINDKLKPQQTKHITLQFIGNVPEATAKVIEQDLNRINMPDFELSITGSDFFISHGIKSILVAKVEQHPNLTLLHDHIGEILTQHGVELDRRQYKPHITLMRLKQPSRELLARLQQKASKIALTITVTGFVLYSVHPDKTPRYIRRKDYLFH